MSATQQQPRTFSRLRPTTATAAEGTELSSEQHPHPDEESPAGDNCAIHACTAEVRRADEEGGADASAAAPINEQLSAHASQRRQLADAYRAAIAAVNTPPPVRPRSESSVAGPPKQLSGRAAADSGAPVGRQDIPTDASRPAANSGAQQNQAGIGKLAAVAPGKFFQGQPNCAGALLSYGDALHCTGGLPSAKHIPGDLLCSAQKPHCPNIHQSFPNHG